MNAYSVKNNRLDVLDLWISFNENDEKLIIYAVAELVGQISEVTITIQEDDFKL